MEFDDDDGDDDDMIQHNKKMYINRTYDDTFWQN